MKKITFLIVCLCSLLAPSLQAQYAYPFQNTSLGDKQRIDNLLSLMTIDEKIEALSTDMGVPRLGIRSTGHSEGLHGLALGGAPGNWGGFKMVDYKREPAIYYSTIFPQAYGLGETWDPQLIEKVADTEANDVRFYAQNEKYDHFNKGGLVMRAPNADFARDPRWGRTEESYGEDPYLVSKMVVGFVKGLQGDNPRYWKVASLMKHFLANSNEDGRDSTSSNFDMRLFQEYYSYSFHKGITDGGSQAFMTSYNSVNGIPMCINPLLDNIVRKQWGFKGLMCTDGGALGLLINSHKAFHTRAEGAAAVVKAGVGQFLDTYQEDIRTALSKGLVNEQDIDNAIRGNYYVALKLGLLDADQTKLPYAYIGVTDTVPPFRKESTKEFVRLVTAKSVVLLKNEKNLLPLNREKIKSIAVIGPRANDVLLDWYSGTPAYTISILQGIKNAVGNNVKVYYEPSNGDDKAILAAQKADVVIVCVGNHVIGGDNAPWQYAPVPSDGREGVDRRSLTLGQEDLVKLVYKANPNTIEVLVSSFPFAINWSQQNIPAIVHITHSSQELGNGLADVLFGKFNPAGRTTQTWVKSITDLPPMLDYDITHGRTYMYTKEKPLYPFGYGLSYTTFAYTNMTVSSNTLTKNDSISVSVDIKNIGKMDGEEVAQLYVNFPQSKVLRPLKQLKGFDRIMLKKGEMKTIHFNLRASDLAYWDDKENGYVVESGKVNLMIGSSSADIKKTREITVQ